MPFVEQLCAPTTSGPVSRTSASISAAGISVSAPNRSSDARVCIDSTMPTGRSAGFPPRAVGHGGLRLYLWLAYRTFALKRQLRLTWPMLYRQFGADPAKATDARAVDYFRTDCLRELQKIQRAWPDLRYRTVKGALLLSPSPPAIAPTSLRLVTAEGPHTRPWHRWPVDSRLA